MIGTPSENDPIYTPEELTGEALKLQQLHLALARLHNALTAEVGRVDGPNQTEDDYLAFHIATNDNPCEQCGRICFTWNVCFHCGRMLCQACYSLYHQCLPDHDPLHCEALQLAIAQGTDYLWALRAKNGLPRLTQLKPKLSLPPDPSNGSAAN